MSGFSFKKIASNILKRIALSPISSGITGRKDLFQNFVIYNNRPTYIDISTVREYFNVYTTNPVFYSAVNIIAKAESNVKIEVWNKKTEQVEPISTTQKIPQKIYQLFANPNPLQSKRELFYQKSIFYNVAGNSYLYGNAPDNFNFDISSVQTLVNVWPQYMTYILAGGYFDALEISDIIKKWVFDAFNFKREFEPNEILHQNYPNTDFQTHNFGSKTGVISGTSVIESLKVPLSNIMLAYESRNVIIKNRGMRAIFSSNKGDGTGRLPLLDTDKKTLQAEMKDYGTLEDQNQFLFTTMPINVDLIDQDVRKLGLFEEIVNDGMIVANALSVPTDLLKLDLKGATYENQDASMKRLYQDNVIPKTKEDFEAMNAWLGLNETEWQIRGSFAHLPILQENKEQNAKANEVTSKYYKDLFERGLVTVNEWLEAVEAKTVDQPWGENYIFELPENHRNFILSMMSKTIENQSNSGNSGTS